MLCYDMNYAAERSRTKCDGKVKQVISSDGNMITEVETFVVKPMLDFVILTRTE